MLDISIILINNTGSSITVTHTQPWRKRDEVKVLRDGESMNFYDQRQIQSIVLSPVTGEVDPVDLPEPIPLLKKQAGRKILKTDL